MTYGSLKEIWMQKIEPVYGYGEARSIIDLVIEKFSGLPKGKHFQIKDKELPAELALQSVDFLNQIMLHRPVQYVLGEAWFLDRLFFVDKSVLIPRPETEELAIWAMETAKNLNLNNDRQIKIIDVGTGSGCIAISLALMLKNAEILAIDVSSDALAVAKKNAGKLGAKVEFRQLDFLNSSALNDFETFDIIVSNPPYIPESEGTVLESHVVDWEPSLALFTPNDDAQIFYRQLASFGQNHLTAGGSILVEGHQDHLNQTVVVFEKAGYTVELRKDIHGNERLLRAFFH